MNASDSTRENDMTAYGLAHLRQAGPRHDEVYQYLERIQATVTPPHS
nr:hypothetical protein [Kibdelosporangium sp. MJ126-NF4]CTQ88855.1 hypothetical protein [Kibdelosporangium sp. MJ126-NF4]